MKGPESYRDGSSWCNGRKSAFGNENLHFPLSVLNDGCHGASRCGYLSHFAGKGGYDAVMIGRKFCIAELVLGRLETG